MTRGLRFLVRALLGFALVVGAVPQVASATTVNADELLDRLAVRAERGWGYDRDLFVHWVDADGDGCDTRAEVLIAESSVATTRSSGCIVRTGRWYSWLDGRTWTDPSDVEIDHLVALAEAWDSGAHAWSATQRRLFANDLRYRWSLSAVTSSVNRAKSDHDPASWLPPLTDARCTYVIRWMKVKYRWRLSIDRLERDSLDAALAGDCGERVVTLPPRAPRDVGGGADGGGTGGGGGGGSGCDPAYPTVCIPPPPPDLDCGDITFRDFTVLPADPHRFDGDGNGIGCET